MNVFLLNIMLALAWAALLGQFTGTNLIVGFGLGYIALWIMQFVMATSDYFAKLAQIISLILTFLWALIQSNLRVAYSVLAPPSQMSPGIVAIPLDLKTDVAIMLLANMITLTPGTLSLDVSNDKRVLYVHGMHVYDPEKFKEGIKGSFEKKVQEVFE